MTRVELVRRAVISTLVACLIDLVSPSAGFAFKPGDGLPTSMDNAPQSSRAACANHSSPAGSLITRALSAGPQLPDQSLAFISGLCIYLPPHYSDSALRYPVVYLLHGGAGAQSDWVTQGHIQQIMDQAYARNRRNAAIVVMPDASPMAAWFDMYGATSIDAQDPLGQRLLTETYLLRWVIPFVDHHYRTIPDRGGRSIDGLSNGGFGAMMLAAKAPGLFAAAGSMDGNLAWVSFGGSSEQYLDTPATNDPATYSPGPGMVSLGYREGQMPANLAENLDHVSLILDMGAIPYCTASELTSNGCEPAAFEQLFVPANRDFMTALDVVHHAGALNYRETVGAHEWQFWTEWFAQRQLPFLEVHTDPPQSATLPLPSTPIPSAFRYRSVAPDFTVWGYHVSVRRSVTEFLDLDRVTKDTILIHGSGQASILTAPRYARGAGYRIDGTGEAPQSVVANKLGQLRFAIDLGPSDQLDGQSASVHDIAEAQPAALQTEQLPLLPNTPMAGVTRHVTITMSHRPATRRRQAGSNTHCPAKRSDSANKGSTSTRRHRARSCSA